MKILVPTDFSESADVAFDYGFQLFGDSNDLEIVLLNSYEMPKVGSSGGGMMNLEEAMGKESERDLSIALKKIGEKYPQVTISTISRYGSLENSIARTCAEEKIDFIVMGTHGASGLKKALIGSNTQCVIENVESPVISVPKDWVYQPIKNIVYATDLERLENPDILSPICDLAEKANATIHIVYVAQNMTDIDLEKEVGKLPLDKHFGKRERKFKVIHSGSVVEGINSYVDEIRADMVVMIPKKCSFWQSIFKSSVTEQLAFQSRVPLLSLRDIEED